MVPPKAEAASLFVSGVSVKIGLIFAGIIYLSFLIFIMD
jgi:hypothetical protein